MFQDCTSTYKLICSKSTFCAEHCKSELLGEEGPKRLTGYFKKRENPNVHSINLLVWNVEWSLHSWPKTHKLWLKDRTEVPKILRASFVKKILTAARIFTVGKQWQWQWSTPRWGDETDQRNLKQGGVIRWRSNWKTFVCTQLVADSNLCFVLFLKIQSA